MVQKNAVYQDKTQHANHRDNPLYEAPKRHLKKQLNGDNIAKNKQHNSTKKQLSGLALHPIFDCFSPFNSCFSVIL